MPGHSAGVCTSAPSGLTCNSSHSERRAQMPTSTDIAALRTLALVGPATSGKTSLVEALSWKSGGIGTPGSVEKGSTVSDHDPLEKKAQRSLNSSVVQLRHRGIHAHLIDTPGSTDFL